MLVYTIINVSIIVLGIFLCDVRPMTLEDKIKNRIQINVYLTLIFGLLFVSSAFRGNMTSDYSGIQNTFFLCRTYGVDYLFTGIYHTEIGYTLANIVIGYFAGNIRYIFIFNTLVMLIPIFIEIRRESKIIWLSLLCFVMFGNYYTSFNISRQIMAAAITFLGSTYLYEKKMLKYFVVVSVAAMFHTTALIMIPCYFILNRKPTKRLLVLFTSTCILFWSIADKLILFGQNMLYKEYITYIGVGFQPASINTIVVPTAVTLFCVLFYKVLDYRNVRDRVWINATFFWLMFMLLGLEVQLLNRFASFFSFYVLLIVPEIVSNIKDRNLKALILTNIVFVILFFSYRWMSNSHFNPYYFIWNQ